jgi:hypothetical protein
VRMTSHLRTGGNQALSGLALMAHPTFAFHPGQDIARRRD